MLSIAVLADAEAATGFDLVQLAQQSPFAIVCIGFLLLLKAILDDRKQDRKEHAELAKMTLDVISDNTNVQRELTTAVTVLAERVERLEDKRG